MGATLIDRTRLEQFEIAARYVRLNGISTPFMSAGLAFALAQWFPLWQALVWAALACGTQILMAQSANGFLRDARRADRVRYWEARVFATSLLAAAAFGSISIAFYIPDLRVNNLLLIAVPVGSVASMAAMTAPYPRLTLIATAPHALYLLAVPLLFEPQPFKTIFAVLVVAYVAITVVTVQGFAEMVRQLVELRIRTETLADHLSTEKLEADAARARAEHASRAKSNFLANMSHELRTPLNAILGFSEIISRKTFGDAAVDRYADYAGDINRSGRHLLALIDDVLDLARIEAGRVEIRDEETALDALFEDVITLVAPSAARGGVHVVPEADDEVLLRVGRRQLKQVLLNITANAVKFTPKGGRVTLSCERLFSGELAIVIADTGVGIAQEDLSRVLEQFGQARHDVSLSDEKGTGLGLPIAKGLIEAHGGRLEIASEVKRGTTVRIILPADRVIAPPSARQAERPIRSAKLPA